jgi:ATP-dependent RNA helicase DeaD
MTTEFTQFNLHPQLVQGVEELGFETPTPIQYEVIPAMIAGRDIIGQAQTGTGKTAAFALPILQNLDMQARHIQGFILAPTRELALQVSEAINDLGRHLGVRTLAVYGGQAYGPQIRQLKRGVHIVVGTPGRLLDLIHKNILHLDQVHTVVLDEADEMLSMGFIEDIQAILALTPSARQTSLFSATLPKEIRKLAERYMQDPMVAAVQHEQVTVAAIAQRYYLVNRPDKLAALTRLFEVEDISSALVFTRTRAGSAELANELTARGFHAEVLNGDLSQEARERTLNLFRQNKLEVLVATDVAARGLDIDDISHVFNFDVPEDPEIYVHRIGRTGRAGKDGIAITFITPREKRYLRQIEAFTQQRLQRAEIPSEEDILNLRESKLVTKMQIWLKRGRCRQEREIIERLIEAGNDPLDVAAAALKIARSDEKQRPIASMSAVVENKRSRPDRRKVSRHNQGRSQHWSPNSHEPGMVRLSLSLGKKQGVRPGDVVGAIASHANIPGYVIGKIHIQEKRTLVDVPEELVGQVLGSAQTVQIHRHVADLQRA